MSGAYTAKPAVPPEEVPVVPTPPPGWDLDWTFPGPYPPGYTPAFTLPMTATAVIVPSGTAAVSGEFRDHADYLTNEPDAIIWTAVIVSSPEREIELRFEGEEEYADSISSDSTLGDFWSVAPSVEFELTRSDEGGIITLTGTSAIDGTTVVGTADISVYAYAYSLNLSGPANMAWDDTASAVVSLRDHGTLGTNEPTGSTLTWTALLDGAAVDLRFSGGAYSSSIESVYSDIGAYWGAEKDIEFDLTEDDVEKTITLIVTSTAFGDELSDTIEIEIDPIPYPVSYVTSLVINSYEINAASLMVMRLKITRTPFPQVSWPQIGATEYGAPPPSWWESIVPDNIVETTNATDVSGEKRIDSSGTFLDNYSYTFAYDANEGGNSTISCTWTMVITMSDGTTRSGTESFTITPGGSPVYGTCYASRITDLVLIFV